MKQKATTESNRVNASNVAASVGYVEPSTRRLTMKSPTASPPRAGTIALTPTRARMAPQIERQRTVESGYDAAMMLRQARLTQPTLTNWQASANASAVQPTSARWLKKTPMSWKTALIAYSYSR